MKCTVGVGAQKIDESPLSPGAWLVWKICRDNWQPVFIGPVYDLLNQLPINGGGSGTPQRFSPDATPDFVDMPKWLDSPFKSTSRVALSRSFFDAGRLLSPDLVS